MTSRGGGPPPHPVAESDPVSKVFVVYRAAPGGPAALSCDLLDVASAGVWSPSAKAFGKADAVTDGSIPLALVGGTLHPRTYVAAVPDVPPPEGWGEVVVTVRPASGGDAIATFAVAGSVTPSAAGVGVAILVG